MMDEHDGEEAIFLGFEKHGRRDLLWRYAYEGADTVQDSPIKDKARKALRGAAIGDRIRIEHSFDEYLVPIVRAVRITGTPGEQMKLMEARIEKLEKRLSVVLTGLALVHNSTQPGLNWIDEKLKEIE